MEMNRREILRGLSLGAGGVLLSPILGQLEAHAAGSSKLPRRFVFVLEGNGLNPQQIQPVGIKRAKKHEREAFRKEDLAGHELPKALEPLAPFKDRLTIVQGLSGRVCGGGHSNNFGALGCYPGKQGPAGETIDLALAKLNPGIFTHVGLGISDKPDHTLLYNASAWGNGKAMPTICKPDLAYNSLFGSAASGSAAQAFQAKRNLLDFMKNDVKRVESNLAGPERERLQPYLHAYESLSDRQSRLNEIKDTLREKGPVLSDKYKSEVETDRLDAHFDMAAAALICGLTNTLTIASGVGDRYFSVKFKGLGIEMGKHSIGHGKSYKGKSWDELAVMIRRYHINLIAGLARKLQAVPEGDGTMLDNTCIVYMSDAAEGHHSRCWEWPFVILGGLGGKLKTGNYIEYPYYGRPQHRTIANLYTTLLHAAGKSSSFGMTDPVLKGIDQTGPLPELLA